MFRKTATVTATIEEVRKVARILVIDDMEFPAHATFERDGYHLERWAEIRNLSQLTDGHYHVILLDVHGVGLIESPSLQGLGILRHIKMTNPAQPVIVYSAKPHDLGMVEYFKLADAVLGKGMSYIEYKERVDALLLRRVSRGYIIGALNRELGDDAIKVPRAVSLADKALTRGNLEGLREYLTKQLKDPDKVDRAIKIVSIGLTTYKLFSG